MFGREPGIILADTNPLFLNALLPDSFVAAPLDGERYVRFRNVVTYDRAQALALVKRGLDESRLVYALFVPRKRWREKLRDCRRLMAIRGLWPKIYPWKRWF
jgi:hypothetical protein